MKEDKKNQPGREPFRPEDTPEPPQVMDTSREPENNQANRDRSKDAEPQKEKTDKEKEQKSDKKLGESPIEIDDETTI